MRITRTTTQDSTLRPSLGPVLLVALVALALVASSFGAPALAQVDYERGRPLVDRIKTGASSVRPGTLQVPLITWGADVATIHADMAGHFESAGLDVSLFVENNFPKQVEGVLSGKTPFLRGTMGMINAAAEVFDKAGIDLVVIYQLSWSTGGDAMVVRDSVSKPSGLKDKTIALQLYGPHMDYLTNVLNAARVPLPSIDFKWLPELTLPTYDTGGKIVDPVNAFLEDDDIDAVMSIIPDALALTSGGEVGTGAAGSVKGAKILVSTKTASRIISDVYAVRSDYLSANRSSVEAFVNALLKGEESLDKLAAERASRRSEYQQLMSRSADLLLGSPQAVPDVEALLGDCELVGHAGNVAFFTGRGTTRTFARLTSEIQTSFRQLGLMKGTVALAGADWDYNRLGRGLSDVAKDVAPVPKQRFDTKKVAARVEQKISVEPTTWAEEGTLFQIEINFEPNQSVFGAQRYAEDFSRALEIAQTYGGSLIVIEGHSDPLGILKAKRERKPAAEVAQMEQQARNLSLERSRAVRTSFLDYIRRQKFVIDESQFVAVGLGITTPKFNPPRTKEEWAANRRVVFRIKQVEAELTEFSPLD